jgi:RsiW-degrading membrane proteinase PrsW (M82 family)
MIKHLYLIYFNYLQFFVRKKIDAERASNVSTYLIFGFISEWVVLLFLSLGVIFPDLTLILQLESWKLFLLFLILALILILLVPKFINTKIRIYYEFYSAVRNWEKSKFRLLAIFYTIFYILFFPFLILFIPIFLDSIINKH